MPQPNVRFEPRVSNAAVQPNVRYRQSLIGNRERHLVDGTLTHFDNLSFRAWTAQTVRPDEKRKCWARLHHLIVRCQDSAAGRFRVCSRL